MGSFFFSFLVFSGLGGGECHRNKITRTLRVLVMERQTEQTGQNKQKAIYHCIMKPGGNSYNVKVFELFSTLDKSISTSNKWQVIKPGQLGATGGNWGPSQSRPESPGDRLF